MVVKAVEAQTGKARTIPGGCGNSRSMTDINERTERYQLGFRGGNTVDKPLDVFRTAGFTKDERALDYPENMVSSQAVKITPSRTG